MFDAVDSPYRVPYDGSFKLKKAKTHPGDRAPGKKACKRELEEQVDTLSELQRRLYADNRFALLVVFQAMDAAGKDGTIRAVTSGVNPAGFQVSSFKQPSSEELDHDFLWRTSRRLPERGRIGIFNRSYYEEVLVVRVHPEYLAGQRITAPDPIAPLWEERLESIADHEKHLARNGVAVVKFWLNVSREEQRERFISRIDEQEKNWKFSPGDVREARHWDSYMDAYADALNSTSKPWAPWYAIPADDKPYMRVAVAKILIETLKRLDPQYPTLSKDEIKEMQRLGKELRRV